MLKITLSKWRNTKRNSLNMNKRKKQLQNSIIIKIRQKFHLINKQFMKQNKDRKSIMLKKRKRKNLNNKERYRKRLSMNRENKQLHKSIKPQLSLQQNNRQHQYKHITLILQLKKHPTSKNYPYTNNKPIQPTLSSQRKKRGTKFTSISNHPKKQINKNIQKQLWSHMLRNRLPLLMLSPDYER